MRSKEKFPHIPVKPSLSFETPNYKVQAGRLERYKFKIRG